ncbi:MAG: oxidoreductase [Marmoricola sp.]
MRRLVAAPLVLAVVALTALTASADVATGHQEPTWTQVTSPGTGPFRGLAAVSRKEAWVGGDNGELWRTTDGGAAWQDVAPPNSAGLGFRRIIPLGHGKVVLFSRGGVDDPDAAEPSLAAEIFISNDNGRTWRLSFVNEDPAAFYDCVDMFADGRRGLALSDPVDGRFRILATADGGRSWHVRPSTGMPSAIDGEFAFATGRCLRTSGNKQVWFGSGFASARIFHSSDGGRTWRVTDSTIAPDPVNGAGVFGLSPRGPDDLLAVGGTFADVELGTNASAYTQDGRTWTAGGPTGGLRASVAWVPGLPKTALSGGFNGTDLTRDGGHTWTTFSTLPYGQVDCAPDGACWGAGEDGTVSRLFLH